jgi:putative FmdB family regulatory protein
MTYEYVCEACGHQWEAEQSIKDSPLKKCVSCGEDKAKRLVSGGTGFLLKGGGWYADLYGSPGSGAGKSGGDDKGGKTTAKADSGTAKSESKPASDSASTSSATPSSSGGSSATPTSSPASPSTAKAS